MTQYVLERTLISDLAEATSVTSADWLIVLKDGQVVANKIHPGAATLFSASNPAALGAASPGSASTSARSDHVHPMPTAANVGALPITGGTLTGSLSISVATGTIVSNIGTGRTGDGNSMLQFYSTAGGEIDAQIWRIGGENAELRIKNARGTGGLRFNGSVVYVRNQDDDGWSAINASAFTVNSDPRNKRNIMEPSTIPSAKTLGSAAIEFEWARLGGKRHLGFDAEQIRDIAPLASVEMLAKAETGETELGIDLAALIAIQARLLADLSERVDELERAGKRTPRA